MFAEFVTFEDSQNSIEKQLYAYMANVKQLECPQHGTFKGYSLKNCPQCIAEYRQGEENRLKHVKIQKRKSEIGIGERFLNVSFDNYRISNQHQANIVSKLREFTGDTNLIMAGQKGNGKTHLAISLIDKLLHDGKSCCYIKFYDLAKLSIKDTTLMHHVVNCDFLVIDEFGTNSSDYKTNILFEVIDKRYDRLKHTTLVSNLTMGEIKDAISETAYSRLKENCLALNFNWEDYRLQGARYG